MTDREMWNIAVDVVRAEYEVITDSERARLHKLLGVLQREKIEIFSIAEKGGASLACAGCGGGCCEKGKYHFTVIDLLAFLYTGTALFTPDFGGSLCPFMGDAGCLMGPSFRPFTCITFHCERIEARLASKDMESLYNLERSLRNTYAGIEELFGRRLTQGLLLSCERFLEGRGSGILVDNSERTGIPGGLHADNHQ